MKTCKQLMVQQILLSQYEVVLTPFSCNTKHIHVIQSVITHLHN